jgi:nucleoside-diphosphate-sugar epimerase
MGYSAQALAKRLELSGWSIEATARSPARKNLLQSAGFQAILFDDAIEALKKSPEQATHVLVSAPPAISGDPVLDAFEAELTKLSPKPKWLAYLSTTGVYGDHAGQWVDEETPTQPSSERAKRRVEAEVAWQDWGVRSGVPVQIFRLAGIYGPGRNQIESLKAGTARCLIKEGQVFSRIHVDDIAATLEASISRPNAGRVYNVCDDEPAPPHEVVEYAAKLLAMPPPPHERFEDAASTLSEMALSFYSESKRVRNQRIKIELNVKLQYPSYREGLRAINLKLLTRPKP